MNSSKFFVNLFLTCCFLSGIKAATEHLDTIFLRLYLGNDAYIDQSLPNASFLVSQMESAKPTVLYVHGFTESLESKSVKTVISAYLQRKDHNVLGVDYRIISNENYAKVAQSPSDVGTVLADALNEMVNEGMDAEKIHIVGHSLGAQIAGHVGRKSSFQVSRITGLDPAGPLFNFLGSHLSSSDARFVDVIHTDYGFYGIARTSGTVDFYPNGGRRVQPGCPSNPVFFSSEDFCSHHRSWQFYSESLLDERGFLGTRCQNHFQFVFGECDKDSVIPMGFSTPSNAEGSYYLVTNANSPYARKEQGLGFRATTKDILLT